MNRFEEITPTAQSLIDELINAIAAQKGWQDALAQEALKATRKAVRKLAYSTSLLRCGHRGEGS
jgi:hypothetical protein